MDFDDIIPILGIIASILGLIFKDKKKEDKKKIKNKKDHPKELSYIEKFKKVGKSLKEEISSALEESKSHDVYVEKSNDHEVRIQNDEKEIEQKEREDNLTFERSARKKMVATEEIRDIIHKDEIGKENLVLNKKNIINGIIMSEILQKPKSLRR